MKKRTLAFALSLLCFWACNKSEEIVSKEKFPPRISIDSPTGVYEVKAGGTITITPEVENGENALYYWIIDDETVSRQETFTATFDTPGSVYVTLRVENPDGEDSEQMRIDVLELEPPVISLPIPDNGLQVLTGIEYTLDPQVKSSSEASFLWTVNGQTVSEEKTYVFTSDTAGVFNMTFTAANEDGQTSIDFTITAKQTLPIEISFPKKSIYDNPLMRSIALGRSLYLRPSVENATDPEYSWCVDGTPVSTEAEFVYTPISTGESTVTLTVSEFVKDDQSDGVTAGEKSSTLTIKVFCSKEADTKRPAAETSSPLCNKVYEYTPAPGQFINESRSGFTDVTTMQQACEYAESRLEAVKYISLGAFGGYITVGFDHSIENRGAYQGYDFSIKGNQFETSSEAGIVWVMQDNNGNGLPDDEWYELAGSQSADPSTLKNYAVTYYRPSSEKADVVWTDNFGQSGTVEYMSDFHTQPYYYPEWIKEDSYTLYGTRLQANTYIDPSNNQWVNGPYAWGYVDNYGSDMLNQDGNTQAGPAKTYFKISNAVNPDGSRAELDFIDFIKVQTGILSKAGILGEVSTEVLGFEDENLAQ